MARKVRFTIFICKISYPKQLRTHERDCIDRPQYQTDSERKFRGWFFGYSATHAEKFKCVSLQGFSSILVDPLNYHNTTAKSIMLDRAETMMHKYYGQYDFWAARRSMVFSKGKTSII